MAAPEPRRGPEPPGARRWVKLKALLWIVVIIFIIGRLVVTGVLKAIF